MYNRQYFTSIDLDLVRFDGSGIVQSSGFGVGFEIKRSEVPFIFLGMCTSVGNVSPMSVQCRTDVGLTFTGLDKHGHTDIRSALILYFYLCSIPKGLSFDSNCWSCAQM